ncbi:MAG: metallophosphoesterase [Spirochaetales bacterium]|nr:metallophosphoesterase [Spirochaetales bacterium]
MKENGKYWPEILERLSSIERRRGISPAEDLQLILSTGTDCLLNENQRIRPPSSKGGPGGLIRLKPEGYFVIVPDLHGRLDFFHAVMRWQGLSGKPVIADMEEGRAQVICVGDAFHSESRGQARWQKAVKEWSGGFKKHQQMDNEMRENLGLLEMINIVKTTFPEQFHFLKGNHENIANERGEGNYPFRKYAFEGEMVKLWVQTFMGIDLFKTIYRWEKSLPLMAEGKDFLVTHAEPGRELSPDEVIDAYEHPEVIYSLTWTDNGQAEECSVAKTLQNFSMTCPESRIFGGHRAVFGNYALRQEGRYVQINKPRSWLIAAFTNMREFLPDENIISLKKE